MKTVFDAGAMLHPHPLVLGAYREGLHDLGSPRGGPSSRWGPDVGAGEVLGQEVPVLSLKAEGSLPRQSWEGAVHCQENCPSCYQLLEVVPQQQMTGIPCGPPFPLHRSLVHLPHH